MSKKTIGGIVLAFAGAAGFYGLGLKHGFEAEHTPRCPDDWGFGSAHVAAMSGPEGKGIEHGCVTGDGITVKVEVTDPSYRYAPLVAEDVLRNARHTIDPATILIDGLAAPERK